jgi:hypothetical protein
MGRPPAVLMLNAAGFSTVFEVSDAWATDFRVALPGEM